MRWVSAPMQVRARLHSDAGSAAQTFDDASKRCRVSATTKQVENPEPANRRRVETGFGPWNPKPGRSANGYHPSNPPERMVDPQQVAPVRDPYRSSLAYGIPRAAGAPSLRFAPLEETATSTAIVMTYGNAFRNSGAIVTPRACSVNPRLENAPKR